MLHTSPRVHAQYCEAIDWEMRRGLLRTPPRVHAEYCEAIDWRR
jgi:predicted Rdx family selenoprotein